MKKNLLSMTAIAAVALGLSGCAEWNKRSLDNTKEKGSNFTRALSEEYRMLGDTEQMVMFDDLDADLWFRKGIKAKVGCPIMPEYLNGWNLRNDKVPELAAARERLIMAMENGARDVAPEMTAHAQVHYDCWVEQTEERWQLDDIRACRAEYYKAMHEVEGMLGNHVVQAPQSHAVLFNLDKANLDGEAHRVLDDAMVHASSKDHGRMIKLVGHTDKIGSKGHNKELAMKRVSAVRNEMVRRGVPSEMILLEVKGENNQSGHIDPDYRRVDVLFMPLQ